MVTRTADRPTDWEGRLSGDKAYSPSTEVLSDRIVASRICREGASAERV